MENARIFALNSAARLGNAIARHAGHELTPCDTSYFANGETCVKIQDSVRGHDVYLVATGAATPAQRLNDSVMEILLYVDTCCRSGAKSVTLFMPCYPYARQDKKDGPRAALSAAAVATMFRTLGVDRIVSMDLHNPSIQGFFNGPFDNIYGSLVLRPYLLDKVFNNVPMGRDISEFFIAVAPDEGAVARTSKYADLFGMDVVPMKKKRDKTVKNSVKESSILGGKSRIVDKTAIIFDDICDTAGTVVAAAAELRKAGAVDVIVCVTHGLLSGPGVQRIRDSKDVSLFICSDSIDQTLNMAQCDKIRVFSIAPIYGEIVKRLQAGESLSSLFG